MTYIRTPFAAAAPFAAQQPVHLNVGSTWVPATVIEVLTGGRVTVSYLVGTVPMIATVAVWLIRAADGYDLRTPAMLTSGAEVAFTDGIQTVAAAPWKSRGRWVVPFTNGQSSRLRPDTKVRVVDDRAAVTVDGIPLVQALHILNTTEQVNG
ncbi:hypothetical protein QEZ54_08435 [Catellatospora sp. KI3]|uniref:hypothetical protein n=1 Tax=Catellatospora sp. KI3 TaxID=3041620 RepID=UPI002483018B|nr:hypothetical protein [Catellatospora sp. KI3]MDI1460988.1 hypothetical protein [Catellatospora sp. KI3]